MRETLFVGDGRHKRRHESGHLLPNDIRMLEHQSEPFGINGQVGGVHEQVAAHPRPEPRLRQSRQEESGRLNLDGFKRRDPWGVAIGPCAEAEPAAGAGLEGLERAVSRVEDSLVRGSGLRPLRGPQPIGGIGGICGQKLNDALRTAAGNQRPFRAA